MGSSSTVSTVIGTTLSIDTMQRFLKELSGVQSVTLGGQQVMIPHRYAGNGSQQFRNAAQHIANIFERYGLNPVLENNASVGSLRESHLLTKLIEDRELLNARVGEVILQDGDGFRVGDAQMVFKAALAVEALTMAADSFGQGRGRRPVVFVPGLMGSELWRGSERLVNNAVPSPRP